VISGSLLRSIVDGYRLRLDGVHGLSHWARVLENGRRLAAATGADLRVVELFAVFHDACRTAEGVDHGHGRRGARLAERLRRRHFDLDDQAFDLLVHACEEHTAGLREGDPTVLTCWDADRLDLLRCRIEPRPGRLCTEAARDPALLAWANDRARRRVEPALLDAEWRPLLAANRD
jgi:uncharacterized protein